MYYLEIENTQYPIQNLCYNEDFDFVYSYFTFTCPLLLPSRTANLHTTSAFPIVLLGYEYQDGYYSYRAVSSSAWDILNVTTNSYAGEATVKTLLNTHLSIPCNGNTDSLASYWVVPRQRVSKLLSRLSWYTNTSEGGGSVFYISLDGVVQFLDLRRVHTYDDAYPINGAVLSDHCLTDWISASPGTVNLYWCDYNGFHEETYVIKENYGVGSAFVSAHTEEFITSLKQAYHNQFYKNYYTSRIVKVSNPDTGMIPIGTVVTLNGISSRFLVKGYTLLYSDLDGGFPEISLTLASCPNY